MSDICITCQTSYFILYQQAFLIYYFLKKNKAYENDSLSIIHHTITALT